MEADKDTFQLYDLKVVVEIDPKRGGKIMCGAKPGDYFTLEGELLRLPPDQGFSIYSLSAVMPLLAAKQRPTARADWMSTDAFVACPDPECNTTMRIIRTGLRTFRHGDTSAKKLELPEDDAKAVDALAKATA